MAVRLLWLLLLLLLLASGQAAAQSFSPASPGTRSSGPETSSASRTSEAPLGERTPSSPPAATEGGDTAAAMEPAASRPSPSPGGPHSASPNSSSAAAPGKEDAPISQKPGLVAIICIFLAILLVGTAVVLVKCYRGREPAFQKLDEVPMQGKATEGSPFAHFPPK